MQKPSRSALRQRPLTSLLGVTCAAAFLLASPGAFAQDAAANGSAAQALFEAAVEEMAAKKYASACPKLEEAVRLVPDAVGAKAQLAECYEAWGRSASAWSQWTLVEALASRQGQTERQELAASRIAALRPRLATLKIRLDANTAEMPGLTIKRDKAEIGRAQWQSAIPVDAGAHTIEVWAPGRVTWKTTVQVPADGAAVEVPVPLLASQAGGAPPPESSNANAATDAATDPPDGGGSGSWQKPVGIVAMGVGGVGLIVGSIFGAMALGANSDANDGPCNADTNECNAEGLGLRDDAVGSATVSTIAFVAGGLLAAGGVVLFVTAPDGDRAPSDAGLHRVRMTAGGLSAEGRF